MISPENIYKPDIIWTDHDIFRNVYVCACTYMHTVAINEKEAMNMKENKEGYIRDKEGEKGKYKCYNYILILCPPPKT